MNRNDAVMRLASWTQHCNMVLPPSFPCLSPSLHIMHQSQGAREPDHPNRHAALEKPVPSVPTNPADIPRSNFTQKWNKMNMMNLTTDQQSELSKSPTDKILRREPRSINIGQAQCMLPLSTNLHTSFHVVMLSCKLLKWRCEEGAPQVWNGVSAAPGQLNPAVPSWKQNPRPVAQHEPRAAPLGTHH